MIPSQIDQTRGFAGILCPIRVFVLVSFPSPPFPFPFSILFGPFATRLVKRHIDRPMSIIVSLGLVDGQPPTIAIPKTWLSIVHRYTE